MEKIRRWLRKSTISKSELQSLLGKLFWVAKVVRYSRNVFEKQVIESVIIQEERGHHILNSKSEYNRCSLPRLSAKLGERDWKTREKEGEDEKEKEK